MTRLINLRERGELHSWINHLPNKPKSLSPAENEVQIKRRPADKGSGAWLEADLPALHGPHAHRPWARALWAIAHGNSAYNQSSGIRPTKS